MSTGPLCCPGGMPRPTTALPQPHSQRQGNRRLKEISCDPKFSNLVQYDQLAPNLIQ